MKVVNPLQRGKACLCCRKRKMKCDGVRPICTQCSKANRASECQYYDKQQTSRTQMLQQKVAKLEARLRELETEQSHSSSSSSSSQSPSGSSYFPDYADPAPTSAVDTFTPIVPSSVARGKERAHSTSQEPHDLSPSPFVQSAWGSTDWSSRLHEPSISLEEVLSHLTYPTASSSRTSALPLQDSTSWWEAEGTCQNKQLLLDIFLLHRHQCCFDVHIPRFQSSLSQQSAQQPHPALMDAIYLMGCRFSRISNMTELEPFFLKRALRGISQALEHSDRVINVLQASCLLAVYFFGNGRILEGYYHSSIAARLAVGLGLHQIPTNDWVQMVLSGHPQGIAGPKASVPLPPPVDAIEFAERIAAFWQVFAVDRAWSVATGLPAALPDDDHPRAQIDTVWPTPIANISQDTSGNVASKYMGIAYDDSAAATETLRAKAIALFERTFRLSSSSAKGDEYWEEYHSLERSLAQFSVTLPCLDSQYQPPPSANTDLIHIHTLVYVATIHLHQVLADTQTASYEKCLLAANAVTTLVRELHDEEYDFLDPISSTCWRCVADVYIRTMTHGHAVQETLALIDHELDILLAAMRRLSVLFPIAGIHATKTEYDISIARSINAIPYLPVT